MHCVIPRLEDYATHRQRADRERRPVPAGELPLVSIITVCRNAGNTIADTIASIRSQDYPRIEHLIIDGASSDSTPARLAADPPNPGWWISEPDRGISDAFNKGLAAAQGDIIGILNADDQYTSGAVRRAVTALQGAPTAGWAFGGCDFTLDGAVVLHQDGDPGYASVIDRTMPLVNHPTMFVRRACYQQAGLFRTDLRLAMDYDLVLRFHRSGFRGVCLTQTQARMALGGMSSRHILAAYAEASRVARFHGRNPLLANLDRWRFSFLPLVRIAAIATGLQRPWRWLRRGTRMPSRSNRSTP
jgi:glycosyltransferase involved in cell wall biosynthesis